jgi:DNA-binding NarL/FixJ family response regulator
MSGIKLLLADDHEIVRKGLRSLFESQLDCVIVGEAADGRQVIALVKELNPDIVILDISMPLLNGLEATRQIHKIRPQTEVLILTMHESDLLIRDALDAGAKGYILKTDAGRELVAAVESLCRHETFFSPRVAQMMLGSFARGQSHRGYTRLTPRQREIVQLIAEGKSSKEVAVALDLSVKTAETHRARIMRKLHCHSVTEVVRYAIRNDIVQA